MSFKLALCDSVSDVRDLKKIEILQTTEQQHGQTEMLTDTYTENVELGLSALLVARAAADRSPLVALHRAPFVTTP